MSKGAEANEGNEGNEGNEANEGNEVKGCCAGPSACTPIRSLHASTIDTGSMRQRLTP